MKHHNGRNAKSKRNRLEIAVIVCMLLLIVLLAVLIGIALRERDFSDDIDRSTEPSQELILPENMVEVTLPTDALLPGETYPSEADVGSLDVYCQLPYFLEDGMLEIESVFQYSGLNPDASWQNGTNTGAVGLTNRSDVYLKSLDLVIEATDGTQLHFLIYDLPPGKTVWAFDCRNTAYDDSALIQKVYYSAEFSDLEGPDSEQLEITVSGMEVSLKNLTSQTLQNMDMRCHSVVEEIYFGGTSYVYHIEAIAPGETIHIFAADCILGETGVAIVEDIG